MAFLRPGQGFKQFRIAEKKGTLSRAGSVGKSTFVTAGYISGILTDASQKEQDSWKQAGHPITHTVVQPFYKDRGKATQYLVLDDKNSGTTRYFYIQGTKNPGELDHFTIYYVEEKEGMQSGNQRIESD